MVEISQDINITNVLYISLLFSNNLDSNTNPLQNEFALKRISVNLHYITSAGHYYPSSDP